jgi:hypothetical protein
VDDDVATEVPTVVRHCEDTTVTLVHQADGGANERERVAVPLRRIARFVTRIGNPGNVRRLDHVEVGIKRPILAKGLVLVDTPGVGGLISSHGAATIAALRSADAVLLVSDASQEYTAPEIDFLELARQLCPTVACVVTKTDLYPRWRTIVSLDADHLRRARILTHVFPVSSVLRRLAVRDNDDELNAESGYPALVEFLLKNVVGRSEQLASRIAMADLLRFTQRLTASMQAELAAQEDPESAHALIAELQAAKNRADELTSRSAKWSQTLADGIADITSDIDYDLRDRMRRIVHKAEQAIDAADPGTGWPELAAWMDTHVAAAASQNFLWATQRAEELVDRISSHFAEGTDQARPAVDIVSSAFAQGRAQRMEQLDVEQESIGHTAHTVLKGSYGGLLMFGMLTGLVGMALLNPISVAAGLVLGGKALREERQKGLKKRRADAKVAVRKHSEEVIFHVGKDSRDMLRLMQRALRDHFTAEAELLSRSLAESVAATQRAVKSDRAERTRRIADLKAELDRIAELERRVHRLAA